MTLARALSIVTAALAVAAPLIARPAAPPSPRIAYLSGNAGEIDPCG